MFLQITSYVNDASKQIRKIRTYTHDKERKDCFVMQQLQRLSSSNKATLCLFGDGEDSERKEV